MEPPLLVLWTLILLGLFSCVANQVCDEDNYEEIDNPRRSVQAVYDDAVDEPICDYGISEVTWFRFTSYSGDAVVEREANNPVPMMHCGTIGPIYIRGLNSHPVTDYEEKNATVCANYAGDTCSWLDTIHIYRCPAQGDPSYFYLYKLKSPPGCSIAYCAGDEIVCDREDYWNGVECVNYLPVMKAFPVFSGPHTNNGSLSAENYFSCEVQYDRQPNDSDARFRVTFLFNGLPLEYIDADANRPPERLQPTILNPDNLVAILDESKLRGRLGREISCQAESYWDSNGDATSTSLTSEEKYYAALESTVNSYSVSVASGSTFNVTFKSTLPFTCSHCVDESTYSACCKYTFRMLDYNMSSIQCLLLWTGPGDTVVMTVYFVPEATQTGNSFALVFEKYIDDEVWGGSLWHDYLIPTVKMTILPQSEPYKMCQSITDPHLLTFDGMAFDNFLLGDFYLVRAVNTNQHMEIQTRHEICNGGQVTCNCGVIVREGNSAFKISICEAGEWSSTIQRGPTVVRLLSQDPEDSSAVYMDGTGLKFSIRMPSGLRVEVDATCPWFSVYVNLPPEYYTTTESTSMCGNSNGNPSDDSNANFDQFRIPDELSYFRQQPPCSPSFNVAATRCGCNDTYPICSNTDPTLNDISPADYPFSGGLTSGIVCTQTPVFAITSPLYDGRSADSDFVLDSDSLYPPYTYDPNFGVNVSFAWPTPTGKTQAAVESYCSDMLQSSPAYTDCSANVDLVSLIAMCTSDIQIVDDWLPISAYAFFFEQSCLNNLAASISNSSDSAHDELQSVSSKLCPNDCTAHGTCSDGTCTCNTGYIGADCSIDQSLPPYLTGIIRGGLCDVQTRPCDVISVYGSGVAFSAALKCRFTDQSTSGQVETQGKFITAAEYSCPVPETTTHRRRRSATTRTTALSTSKVSITVDGVLYSNELDFVLFDSVCMECNSTTTCRQTDNSCLISDECFADKAVNPGDSCLQCLPDVSRNSWTNVTVFGEWSQCTRVCDTGVKTRNIVCTNVTTEEVEFCKIQNCPDYPQEKPQGVGITLSSPDLKLMLIEPTASLVPFSDALNQYCSKNAAACCNSIGMETSASAVVYTSPDFLSYASGYPVINSSDASLKIIVKIDRAKLEAECSQTPPEGSYIEYGAPSLLYDAITSEESEIEQALSITITSVWSPTSSSFHKQ